MAGESYRPSVYDPQNTPYFPGEDLSRTGTNRNDIWSMHYPLELVSPSVDFSKRPVIIFRCNGRSSSNLNQGASYITFPIPQGIDFSDGADYDSSQLGMGGSAVYSAIKSAQAGGDLSPSGLAQAGINAGMKTIDRLKQSPESLITAALGNSKIGNSNIGAAVGKAIGAIVNPHVITSFGGIGTRSFGFKFKMIGSSQAESDMIQRICHTFRYAMYPEGDELALKYPPTWNIRFMMNKEDIKYIPKIFECYCTGVQVSYNSSGNAWHADGSPVECDLSINFKETRSLTAQDIDLLNKMDYDSIKFNERVPAPVRTETLDNTQNQTQTPNPNQGIA